MVEYLTFSACINEFMADRQSRGKSPKTITYYELELKYFNRWLEKQNLAMNLITTLTSSNLREFYIELSSHRNKGGCHANYRAVKAFLNWSENEYDIEWKNPIKKVKIEPNKIPPLPEIPLENIQKLLNVCKGGRHELRDKAILKVLVDTGMRGSELLSLNVESVDTNTGKILLMQGKGGKSRLMWLGDKGKKALIEYLATRDNPNPTEPLILNDEGDRLKFHGLRQIIIRLSNRAGILYQGVHSFRRCFALTLWKKKVDLLTISRLLGHSNLAVTTRYLNVGNSDLMENHNRNSPADILN